MHRPRRQTSVKVWDFGLREFHAENELYFAVPRLLSSEDFISGATELTRSLCKGYSGRHFRALSLQALSITSDSLQ